MTPYLTLQGDTVEWGSDMHVLHVTQTFPHTAYTTPTLGPIHGLGQKEESLLTGKEQLFPDIIAPFRNVHPIHNSLIECNVLQSLKCIQDKNSS